MTGPRKRYSSSKYSGGTSRRRKARYAGSVVYSFVLAMTSNVGALPPNLRCSYHAESSMVGVLARLPAKGCLLEPTPSLLPIPGGAEDVPSGAGRGSRKPKVVTLGSRRLIIF